MNVLVKGKEEGGTGFSKGWQGYPKENPVPPDSFPFTNIVYYIEVILLV